MEGARPVYAAEAVAVVDLPGIGHVHRVDLAAKLRMGAEVVGDAPRTATNLEELDGAGTRLEVEQSLNFRCLQIARWQV